MKWIDVRVNKKPLYDPHPKGVCSCPICSAGHSPSGRLLAMDIVTGKVLYVLPKALRETVNFILDGYRTVEFSREADNHRKEMRWVHTDFTKLEEQIVAHYIGEGRELLVNPPPRMYRLDDVKAKSNVAQTSKGNRKARRRAEAKSKLKR